MLWKVLGVSISGRAARGLAESGTWQCPWSRGLEGFAAEAKRERVTFLQGHVRPSVCLLSSAGAGAGPFVRGEVRLHRGQGAQRGAGLL